MDEFEGTLSPDGDSDEERIRRVVEFWNQLRVHDATGRTSWGNLEPLERQVTECLVRRRPRDISRAESLTAIAMHLIAGQGEP
jgi:hypothetical protein